MICVLSFYFILFFTISLNINLMCVKFKHFLKVGFIYIFFLSVTWLIYLFMYIKVANIWIYFHLNLKMNNYLYSVTNS